MERLQKFQTLAQGMLVACATFTLGLFEERSKAWVTEHLEGSPLSASTLIRLGLVLAIFASIKLFEALIDAVIGRSRLLRRWIMGAHYVEGTWIDVGFTDEPSPVWSGGVLRIFYDDGKLVVKGDTFDEAGRHVGDFSSGISNYDGHVLRYWFDKHKKTEQTGEMRGASEYAFNSGPARPDRFEGKYFSTGGAVIVLHGERLGRKEAAALQRPEEMGERVRAFIADYRRVAAPR